MLNLKKGFKLHKYMLWVFVITLVAMTSAAAAVPEVPELKAVVVLNKYGMTAPFLISWIPVWVFSLAGGIGSNFFKMPDIDKHFRYLLVAKPFLGVFGGIALCLLVSDGSEPPEISLIAYALGASLLSAPILQGLIAVVTMPKNQASLFNAVNPFKFKIVVADNGDSNKENDNA